MSPVLFRLKHLSWLNTVLRSYVTVWFVGAVSKLGSGMTSSVCVICR